MSLGAHVQATLAMQHSTATLIPQTGTLTLTQLGEQVYLSCDLKLSAGVSKGGRAVYSVLILSSHGKWGQGELPGHLSILTHHMRDPVRHLKLT